MNEAMANLVWNLALVAVLGFMIRLWMKDVKDAISKDCLINNKQHEKFESQFIEHTRQIAKLEVKVEK